jgi:FixJ family two-component response regulator
MNRSPTVYLVDDDLAVRDALSMLLEERGFEVTSFEGGPAFLETVSAESRGCAIVDLRMPGMDGLALQAELKRRGVMLGVVILTGHGDIPASVNAMKGGAVNFLTKPVEAEKLIESVSVAIAESDTVRYAAFAARGAAERLASLTTRERDVLALAVDGLPNKEIARALGISHRTVEIHKGRIMHKTGASSLLELSRMAVQDAASPHPALKLSARATDHNF